VPSATTDHQGENNGQTDRVERDSGGKNVLLRRAPREGHSTITTTITTLLTVTMRTQGERERERERERLNCTRFTGASNLDDIAPRYITRDFMAYYRTV